MTIDEFLKRTDTAFFKQLPGIEAHKRLAPQNRALTRDEVPDIDTYNPSAVAVVCFPVENQINTILIQRPPYDGSHGGQISFPGGKLEKSDPNLEYTARRETQEEIGWNLCEDNHLGALTELFIPVSRFTVTPHLYYCEKPQLYLPNDREVAEIIQFQLDDLKNESLIKHTNIPINKGVTLKNVPYFDIQQKVVWGATAIILSELKSMLFENE
jgi:8-oxo-dGTP pyrophosphatase MutT (NUDIX family)